MKAFVGTSGWIYKDWAKRFYPEDIKQADKLSYFARHFKTVEINSTFYRLPSESAVSSWYDSVPDDFVFAAKLSRYLTHILRLAPGDRFDEGLKNYLSRIAPLKEKLGAILVQLPAWERRDVGKLDNLGRVFSKAREQSGLSLPLAIEYRHDSWYNEEVFRRMRAHNIANVIASSGGRWPENHTPTADFAYVRFHGPKSLYASSYSNKELECWARFIKNDLSGCRYAYCYFNNDKSAKAVDNADYLESLL